MSTARLHIVERGEDLVVTVESSPPLPMLNGKVDVDRLTTAQAAAIYAAQAIGEAGDNWTVVSRPSRL